VMGSELIGQRYLLAAESNKCARISAANSQPTGRIG
jgi:hypothetical protein